MMTPSSKPPHLAGKVVFLSASIPLKERSESYPREMDTSVSIEEAVIAVSRAIFSASGTLVFGAHPSISPLVASVLGEYFPFTDAKSPEKNEWPKRPKEPAFASVIMYQSKVWEPLWADASRRLAEHSQVDIRWVPSVNDEVIIPTPSKKPQAPLSMKEMRKRMIQQTSPIAMIVIGGMEGTEEESQLFSEFRPGYPIYCLATTGGAAHLLAERRQLGKSRIFVVDQKARENVMAFWMQQEKRDPRRSNEKSVREGSSPAALSKEHYYVPYSFLAQEIVAEISDYNRPNPGDT